MNWTRPEDLHGQLRKLWDRGELLAARIRGEDLFPRALRLRRPASRDIAEHFSAVRDWVRALRAGSRQGRGHGYEIRWRRIRHPVQGANDLPDAIVVPTEEDALRLIGRTGEMERFSALARETLERFPALRPWLERRPHQLLKHAEHWPRFLDILAWFHANPRPGLYLRQLEIPGVDTKLIERHRGLLSELLDQVLPGDAIDPDATGVRGFARRYGLRDKPVLIRFRILDPTLAIQGLTDLSVPREEFARLSLPVERVFITENEINGLAFPEQPRALVIFGLGYGLERLAEIPWLHQCRIHYWGDIDTHGFAMLDRLRSYFPHADSFLMDRETLEAHRELWGGESPAQRFEGSLSRLSREETELLEALREDRFGERVRLEQERIGFAHVRRALESLQAL